MSPIYECAIHEFGATLKGDMLHTRNALYQVQSDPWHQARSRISTVLLRRLGGGIWSQRHPVGRWCRDAIRHV